MEVSAPAPGVADAGHHMRDVVVKRVGVVNRYDSIDDAIAVGVAAEDGVVVTVAFLRA